MSMSAKILKISIVILKYSAMKKTLVLSAVAAFALFCCPSTVDAQGNSPNAPGRQNPPGNSGNAPGHNKHAPIDGGLSLLVGAGLAYALKKGYDKKKKSENHNYS